MKQRCDGFFFSYIYSDAVWIGL